MKKNQTLINELREELRYHQTMVRVDIRALRAGIRKCKEIGSKMRALQSPHDTAPKMPNDWRPEPFVEKFEQKELL